ncbi:hypothetical protein H634G_03460 [Metarhizium anisopliae BRIP 53293]|uniref:Dickkopf N-terminal cysteine-rich domain-containing protein n=1 Tax=Metarhizium anisopliae BRIP 53293 TaxID=1291518 RepID=A0A0D9P3R9_METAN|nr:hypothetical protein H634G_03460 [Metarhizium anisopliae BRIP 53293]KJK92065.1 hypothetical protein H633G_04101 [Metarhizium anisopliae BRIP 53284]
MRYIFVFLSFAVAAFATADNPDDACKDLSDGFGCFWTQGDCNRGGTCVRGTCRGPACDLPNNGMYTPQS